jgi:g-D-glutamyl-meso-diaminopimelate peptidase
MLKLKYLKKGLVNFWQERNEPYVIPSSGIEKSSIGESVEKRPIHCFRVGRGERKILFVSAIHGNEIGTIKLAYFLLDYLSRNEKKFEKTTFFIVPCLNTDGFKKAKEIRGYFKERMGRLNTHGVDLNRNFPTSNFRSHCFVLPSKNSLGTFKYSKEIAIDGPEAKRLGLSSVEEGKKGFPKTKICGKFGGSEPETKALIDFIVKERISIVFSFHNVGRDVMGGEDQLSKELVEIYAEKSGYEIVEDDEWRKLGHTGTAKDWCDGRGISFVEVEGSARYHSDWKDQKPALEAVLEYLEKKA